MSPKKSIYLIDGSSYIYRAFFALGRFTNSKGLPTQAVFGFAQMILKIVREKKPDYLCVVFDAPGPTFRHEKYGDYKATRQKMPEDLVVQVPYIKELVRLHGLPQIEATGYEADDLIAILAQNSKEAGLDVVIVSGDKDLHQLIEDPRVVQWDPQRDRVFDERAVEERFGVTPRRMADYLALVGDSSDNIPGVKGVGEKTAKQLLQQWGSLDRIYDHLGEITSESLVRKLQASKEAAYISKELVLFKMDAPVPENMQELTPASPSIPELLKLYDELEFKSLLTTLRNEWGSPDDAPPAREDLASREDKIVRSLDELSELVECLKTVKEFSIDIETTSKDPMRAKLVGVAISFEDRRAFYIPVSHCGPNCEGQIDEQDLLKALEPFLTKCEPGKIGQNIKYEWVVFKRHGVQLDGIAFDTMVANYLLEPGTYAHGLERIASEHLGETMLSYNDVTGSGKTQTGFAEVDVLRAAEYACGDAETTWRLVPILDRKLRETQLSDLYRKIELPLIEILGEMEYRGILVDAEKLDGLSIDFEKALDQKAGLIYGLAKEEFNIQSPKQLASILFEKLGLPARKMTKSGPSTDVRVLEELALLHPLPEQVLAYRSLAKLKGTYADALPKLIHPETGRIHTSYNQTVAATGRLSSSEPNLQNIPIRTEEGRKIRSAFVAAPGRVLLSADYSQIELRILAHYSRDAHLMEAFRTGMDVHLHTASEVFGIPSALVTSEMRRQAKTINFGIIYGMSAFGLAQRLRISNKAAKTAIDQYFARYSGVKNFIDQVVETARKLGYSETLLGRRRAMPELRSRNHSVRQQGERLAVNTPIQGTAADLIKKTMIDLDGSLKARGIKTAMLLQVHDELVFEVPEDELDMARGIIREEMESVWELSVPLKVDIGWGRNWAEAHP
ncbi:MAG: DNA polymerase I [Syntrophobacteraceae bacterium]